MTTKATTAWGETQVLEEVTLPQRAGEKEFVSAVQLLVDARGERYVRFAYTTGGAARRGPVTLREEDLVRLRDSLGEHPQLADMLALASSDLAAGGGGSTETR
ncbi:MAG: hypothetical protein M3304_04790 [Actinomycetota bacterium]|nr:hypothetical protein [Actinomycetota bacterium]